MQIDFLSVFLACLALILLAIPGFILQKTKLLPEKAAEAFSNMVLYACQTALVFIGFQSCTYKASIGINMLIVAGITIVVYILSAVIVSIFCKDGPQGQSRHIVRYASVFGNVGFMGLPFLQMLFGGTEFISEVLIYSATVIAIFNILNWTLGVYLITGDKKEISFKKIVTNPVIISVVLGFLLFIIAQKPLVELAPAGSGLNNIIAKIMNCIKIVADTVTPLSMFVVGIKLANINIKQLFCNKWAYVAAFIKLVVVSLLTIAIVLFLPIAEHTKYVLFFLMSMPPAASTTMYAVRYNKDAETGAIVVLLSTIISVATISLMFLLFNFLMGIV